MTIELGSAQWGAVIVALVGIVSPLVATALGTIDKIMANRKDKRNTEYEQYHKLVESLSKNDKGMLECQIGIVYELRRFRSYRHATVNVLESFYRNNNDYLKDPKNYLGRSIRSVLTSLRSPFPIIWRWKQKYEYELKV